MSSEERGRTDQGRVEEVPTLAKRRGRIVEDLIDRFSKHCCVVFVTSAARGTPN